MTLLRWWYSLTTCRANTGSDREGYSHWYCQHPRWHRARRSRGLKHVHRYRNYLWPEGGSVRYEPIPLDMQWPRCDSVKPDLGPRTPRPLPPEAVALLAAKAAYKAKENAA